MNFRFGLAACAILFLCLISFRINAPWRLMHEDTGAVATAFAQAHLRLGLKTTKGHDFWADKITGQAEPYAHHPPGSNLILALLFKVFSSRSTAIPRGLSVAFHLLSLVLIVACAHKIYGEKNALTAAFLLAIIPMSSFFGRLMSPDPLTLPACLVFVTAYFRLIGENEKEKRPLFALILSSLWGAWMGWQIFFAMISCLLHAGAYWLHTSRQKYLRLSVLIVCLGLGLFLSNLAHLYWAAGQDGLQRLLSGFSNAARAGTHHPWWQILGHVLEFCRQYFTEILMLTAAAYFFVTIRKSIRGEPLRFQDEFLGVLFCMGILNIVFFPNRARNHHYWAYYLLPFMTLAFLETKEAWQRLWPSQARKITAVCLILIAASSAVTLYKRHTRENGYTLWVVEELRRYL